MRDKDKVIKKQEENLGRIFELIYHPSLLYIAKRHADSLGLKDRIRRHFMDLFLCGFNFTRTKDHLTYQYMEKIGDTDIFNVYILLYDYKKDKLFRLLKISQEEREKKREAYHHKTTKRYKISEEGIKHIVVKTNGTLVY